MFFPRFLFHFLVGALGVASVSAAQEAARSAELTRDGNSFRMNGRPFKMWGIRTAGATQDRDQMDHLLAQLDDYKAHGVNSLSVFYMGCSGAFYDPFTPDGRGVDADHQQRMEQIIRACAAREMAVIVGLFYQRAPFGLRDADAVRQAVRTVTTSLRPFRNVMLNIANEQNSNHWRHAAPIFDFREPERIIELCALVHEIDPKRLAGGGGYDLAKNLSLGRSPHVDALLFDFNRHDVDAVKLYDDFVRGGVTDKPLVNVELFGAYSGKGFERGIFPPEFKRLHFAHLDAAAERPGLHMFLHNTLWCQREPMRYDLAGQGSQDDPGIRWYFEYVRAAVGRAK